MLKILQTRLQQYVNLELPDVQSGFRKDRGTRDQIANIRWIIEKAREFQKNIYFCFIDYATEMGVTGLVPTSDSPSPAPCQLLWLKGWLDFLEEL